MKFPVFGFSDSISYVSILWNFGAWNFDLHIYTNHLRLFVIIAAFVVWSRRSNYTLPWFNIESSLFSHHRASCPRIPKSVFLKKCHEATQPVVQQLLQAPEFFEDLFLIARTNVRRTGTVLSKCVCFRLFCISGKWLFISICLKLCHPCGSTSLEN